MNKLNQAPLFDKVAMGYVLGSIMHQPSLLYAEDKDTLNKTINDLTSTSNFKNVQLYELDFKEIPLKKKVVFGI